MLAVTLKTAKARLNELVNRALDGEDVVLMRGSRHVVAFRPITEDDLSLTPMLTDAEAKRFIDHIEKQRAEGHTRVFPSAEEAVEFLRQSPKAASRKRRNAK